MGRNESSTSIVDALDESSCPPGMVDLLNFDLAIKAGTGLEKPQTEKFRTVFEHKGQKLPY